MRAKFNEIAPQSLSDRVIDALKDAFFSGELKPGDAIVEREIARQMKVGTPVVREALISLQGQGFVRRIINTGTYVTKFSSDEIRQLYELRIELEVLALQWVRTRATKTDLADLRRLVQNLVEAGERGDRRSFLECDYTFHRHCWLLCGNSFLGETLDRLLAPLLAFVVLGSDVPHTAEMGIEHFKIVDALESLEEPDFSTAIRNTLMNFADRWLSVFHIETSSSQAAAAE